MVWQWYRRNIIHGVDVVLDSTTLQAWYHRDPDAGWRFPKRWKGSMWGYKVHPLFCRWSEVPIMVLVTPANCSDSLAAIPLLTSVRVRQPERAKCLSREKVSWVDDNKQSDRKAD